MEALCESDNIAIGCSRCSEPSSVCISHELSPIPSLQVGTVGIGR